MFSGLEIGVVLTFFEHQIKDSILFFISRKDVWASRNKDEKSVLQLRKKERKKKRKKEKNNNEKEVENELKKQKEI